MRRIKPLLTSLASIFTSLAGLAIFVPFIVSAFYFAGNNPEFKAFFCLWSAVFFIVFLVKKTAFCASLLTQFKWGIILLYIMLFLSVIHLFPVPLLQNFIYQRYYIAPSIHLFGLIYWISLFFIFVISVIAAHQHQFKINFLRLFFLLSIMLSAYGIYVYFMGNTSILWMNKTAYTYDLTSTFINRNSFALFASCGFLTGIFLLRHNYKNFILKRNQHLKHTQWINIIDYCFSHRIIFLVGLTIIFISIILTHSRSGVILSILSACLFYIFSKSINPAKQKNKRYKKRHYTHKYIVLSLCISIIFISPIIFYDFFERLVYSTKDLNIRLEVYSLTAQMIIDRPFLGYGLGSFEYIFPYYKTQMMHINFYWDKAHSTFLEMASEVGLIFTSLIIFIYARFYVKMVRYFSACQDTQILLYLLMIAILVLHSLIDFSLQMPVMTILIHIIFAFAYHRISYSKTTPDGGGGKSCGKNKSLISG